MYTIRANNNLLYDPRVEELAVLSAVLDEEDNVASSFSFSLDPNHPLINQLQKLVTEIEVFDGTARIFGGRIIDINNDIDNVKMFECESELTYLADSVVRPYSWGANSAPEDDFGVEAYLTMLIDRHNEQVGPEKQFEVGEVTVVDPNNLIVRASSGYPSTLDEVLSKLPTLLGGHITVRKSAGVRYIDYLEDSPYISDQTIELGENMLDLMRFSRGSDIATAVIPLGANMSDEEGDNQTRITIETVNDGLDYIADEDARVALGLESHIFRTVTHDNITTPAQLKTAGIRDLAAMVNPLDSIELRAVDLKKLGLAADNFRFLEYVKVKSDKHGIDGTLLVTKMSTDLLNPGANSITVGSDYGTFTQRDTSLGKRVNLLENNSTTISTSSQIVEVIRNLSSSLVQTEDSILATVSEEYVSQESHEIDITELSTIVEQTSNSVNFTFNTLQSQISNIEGDTKTRFEELVKYIRFQGGDIILGEVNNELALRIQNDRISFLQAGVEVAYMSNNKLYITDANILDSLQIGRFAFTPRDNGNLSFNMIGDGL